MFEGISHLSICESTGRVKLVVEALPPPRLPTSLEGLVRAGQNEKQNDKKLRKGEHSEAGRK